MGLFPHASTLTRHRNTRRRAQHLVPEEIAACPADDAAVVLLNQHLARPGHDKHGVDHPAAAPGHAPWPLPASSVRLRRVIAERGEKEGR